MQPDPRTWRPQAFGHRKPRDVADPIVEPAWSGIRVLAHVGGGRVRLVDAGGEDLGAAHPELARELAEAALADTLVVDGYLTHQALRSGVGVLLDVDTSPGMGEQVTQFFFGSRAASYVGDRTGGPRRGRAGSTAPAAPSPAPAPAAAGGTPPPAGAARVAFVAVDLLAIDDQPLLDVPLLERKRILESALAEGELVRRTPFVREPAGTFVTTWRSAGFVGLAYKAANSRYLPGDRNDDWALIEMPRR
jgi:bifunctional non-homologous end joining protein LigD